MQGLCSYGMQHLNFDLLLTARIRPSAKRKERGLWLRAGSVMEQAGTLRSGLLGGSRVGAPSCHRGADYGVRRVVLEVGIEPTA